MNGAYDATAVAYDPITQGTYTQSSTKICTIVFLH